jgi:hypothetical protein
VAQVLSINQTINKSMIQISAIDVGAMIHVAPFVALGIALFALCPVECAMMCDVVLK